MKSLKAKLQTFGSSFSAYMEEIFSNKKKTFKFIALFVFTVLFLIEVGIILINNSFYTNFSDDLLQYYTIMVDFIAQIKEGTISWFNLNNYFGASFFSDIYYIPLDIFTFITFILSYIMPTEVAYSVTELIKIFGGVMALAYYLSLKGHKNRTIFWMSVIYLISGGSVSFMAFPVFLSLTFYLPVSLLVIHFFLKGKKWIVPLFVFLIILYDFYLGYTILVFMSFAFLIEYFKNPDFNKRKLYKGGWLKFISDGVIFLSLLLLGVVMSAVVLYPSMQFILNDTFRTTGTFNPWFSLHLFTIKNTPVDIQFFQPDLYIRFLAKIFAEQKPIGFYGFQNDYSMEHISLYISIIGFAYMLNVFFMKGRKSNVYKVTLLVSLLFMLVANFSYLFSGTTDVPYTRWINMLPLIEIMILAHVFDEYGFEKVRLRNMIIIIVPLLALVGFLIYYYIKKLGIDTYYAARDVMTIDTILMGVAAVYLILLLIFLIFRKYRLIKIFFWIEFLVAIGYIYSGPFSIQNKLDTFNSMSSINTFLEDALHDDSQFYRVYVDVSGFNAEVINFNRMTSYPTNTDIFHSWTDKETNEIGHLLFNSWEYQSKKKLDFYGYYLDQFLGYKYILVNAEDNYTFDSNFYKLVYFTDKYKLYEIDYYTPFKVYDDYITYSDFASYRRQYSTVPTQKILLMAVLVDSERYDTSTLGVPKLTPVINDNSGHIIPYRTMAPDETITSTGMAGTTEKQFYVFNADNMNVDFSSGALYMQLKYSSLSDLGQVYLETADGHQNACQIQSDNSQIKCEFWSQPEKLYVEKTADLSPNFKLRLRTESAIDGSAYLVYDLSSIATSGTSGTIQFSNNYYYKFGKVFVTDQNGNEYNCLNGFFSYDSTALNKIYIFKTTDMYKVSNLYGFNLNYTVDNLSDSTNILENPNINNENLTIKNGRISLSYNNVSLSTTNQIVMIPVTYSKDWIITNGVNYDTISVSGGFLGIIVPAGTTNVQVDFKYVPTGLMTGVEISAGGIVIYLGVFLLPRFVKKKKANTEMDLNETSENNSTSL